MIYRYFILSNDEYNEINTWIKDNLTQRYRLYYLKDRDCFGLWTYKQDAIRVKLRWSGDSRFSDLLPKKSKLSLEDEIVFAMSQQIVSEIDNEILKALQNCSIKTAINKSFVTKIKEIIFK